MLKYLLLFFSLIASFLTGFFIRSIVNKQNIQTTSPISKVIPKPLEKYSIENLSQSSINEGGFEMGMKLSDTDDFVSYLFHFNFIPDLTGKETKQTQGQIHLPTGKSKKDQKSPVIIMIRGYINQETFKSGDGTRKAAEVFARNGFITIAPDFLGYGNSDPEAENIFETRFQTYVTVLSLIKSLNQVNSWDGKNIFIWGHSNGGQIALTVLEAGGAEYPTTLWAPVSKPFPYSVLYYTDESDDHGKLIRRELAKFEELYDVEKYSLTNYFERINVPIQIHQGTADDAVPVDWSNDLVKKLKDKEISVKYFVYEGADHNLRPSWDTVVTRDIEFFESHLK